MSPQLKKNIALGISLALAIILVLFAFRGINFNQIKNSFENANWWWIFLSVALGIFAYWLRSERWKLLLESINPKITSKQAFIAVCMNYFWNLIIPRSGEVARCTSLYATSKTPVDKSFGTVIIERIIDLFFFGIIFLIALFLNIDLIKKLFKSIPLGNRELSFQYEWLFIFIGIIFVGVLLAKKLTKTILYEKFIKKISGLLLGLKAIQKLRNKRKFILYSILIWIAYFFMTYIVVFALPDTENISISEGFFILFVGAIGMIIPANGGIGSYHAAMRLGFITLGFSAETGIAFGFLVHTPHTLISLVLGLISLIANINSNRI